MHKFHDKRSRAGAAMSFLVALTLACAAFPGASLARDGSSPATGPEGGADVYAYRLLVGMADVGIVREGDVVLGSFGSTSLLGYTTADDLQAAWSYYREAAEFAVIDGVLEVAEDDAERDGDVPIAEVESVESAEATAPVAAGEDPISNLVGEVEALEDVAENPQRTGDAAGSDAEGGAAGDADADLPERADSDGLPAACLVALVDTGVADGIGGVRRASVLGDGEGFDDHGHGTAMHGAIVAENPGAEVLSVKALDAQGAGSVASVYAGIEYAIAAGADVINLSLSARASDGNAAIAAAVEDALEAGAVVVAAAGNAGEDASGFTPGNAPGAFTVGAADMHGTPLPDSNYGDCVDLFAIERSTSYAAARASGWLSAELSDGWRDRIAVLSERVPEAFDGGDGEGDGDVQAEVPAGGGDARSGGASEADGLSVAATFTMTLKYNVNGGTFTYPHQYASNRYYKYTSAGVLQYSTTANGTYQDSFTKITTETTCQDLVNVIGRTGAAKTGYHVTNAEYFNTKADGSGVTVRANQSADTDSNPVTTKRINGGKQITADKTVMLYVNWVPNSYTVTYDANGGTGAPSATTHTYDAAKALASGKPTRAHYSFAGWQVNGAGTVYSAGQSVKNLTSAKNGTVAMKAKWVEDPKYTVTYNGNGGTPARASDTAYTGTAVTLPSATRAGYTFAGWASSASATSGATGSYTVTSNATLYAVWTEDKRTVRYNGNGGTPSRSSDSVASGSSVVLPAVASRPSDDLQDTGAYLSVSYDGNGGALASLPDSATRASQYRSYSFSGWYTAASGGSYVGTAGSSYVPPAGTTDLYMHWETSYLYRSVTLPQASSIASAKPDDGAGAYRVVLDANGGALPGSAVQTLSAQRTRRYSFSGWNTSPSGAETGYAAGSSLVPSGNLVLYAQWTATETVGSVTLPVPERAGFEFRGWGVSTSSPSGVTGRYTPSGDTTLYALWSQRVGVEFDSNGGTGAMPAASGNAGGRVEVPPCSFTRAGYLFRNWNTEPDGSGAPYEAGGELVLERDMVLYAQWDALQLSFSVPSRLGYVMRADGTLIAADDDEAGIASLTDAGIAVTGVRAQAASGCAITADPHEPGEVEFSFSPLGFPRFSASSATGPGFLPVDWQISKRSTLALGDFEGRIARWDAVDAATQPMGTLNWRVGMREVEVAFNGNGASGAMEPQAVNAEVEFAAPACGFAGPAGKTFAYWNTDPSGTGESFESGQPISLDDDTTLYAIWR